MVKSELVQRLAAQDHGLRSSDIARIVDTFFATIADALIENNRAELRGFGTFSTRSRVSRQARNPRTGAAISVEAKRMLYFKCSKTLSARLNEPD